MSAPSSLIWLLGLMAKLSPLAFLMLPEKMATMVVFVVARNSQRKWWPVLPRYGW
jgi:hypothetical protein